MTNKRILQTNQQQKSEKPQASGILQRAAVRSVSDLGEQSTEDKEAQPLSNLAFSKDFSQVPISTAKPQQIMTKLMIGPVGDKYEQEADRVAKQVVQRINAPVSVRSGEDETVQREEMETKDNEARLMRSPILQCRSSDGGMAATPNLEAAINRARGGGQRMADNIRKPMEQAFGADFSGVKVHTDAKSDQLNRSIQARAFTRGQDVFFMEGEYNPGSRGGQELLAHELTHVVQQNGSAVDRAYPTKSLVYRNGGINKAIQRRVGFEFEVDWKVRRPPTKEEEDEVKIEDKSYKKKMKKGRWAVWEERLKDLPNWLQAIKERKGGRPTDEEAVNAYQHYLLEKKGVPVASATEELMMLRNYILGQKNIAKGEKIMGPPSNSAKPPEGQRTDGLWHLTADMNAGSSQLEWVTEPLESEAQVKEVMKEITAMAGALEKLAKEKKVISAEDLSDVGYLMSAFTKNGFQIYPRSDRKLLAEPQVTGGFRLDQVANMMEEVLEKRSRGDKDLSIYRKKLDSVQSGESRSVLEALKEVRDAERRRVISTSMAGLLALILNYMRQGAWGDENNPLKNSKGIANAFMSRTDFAHNYKQTQEARQGMTADKFVSLVSQVTELDLNERVLPWGYKERESELTKHDLKLTRGEWLRGMAEGRDLLRRGSEVEGSLDLHSSLGALGSVSDVIGPYRIRAVVIELRRMSSLQGYDQWTKCAVDAFGYINELGNRRTKEGEEVVIPDVRRYWTRPMRPGLERIQE